MVSTASMVARSALCASLLIALVCVRGALGLAPFHFGNLPSDLLDEGSLHTFADQRAVLDAHFIGGSNPYRAGRGIQAMEGVTCTGYTDYGTGPDSAMPCDEVPPGCEILDATLFLGDCAPGNTAHLRSLREISGSVRADTWETFSDESGFWTRLGDHNNTDDLLNVEEVGYNLVFEALRNYRSDGSFYYLSDNAPLKFKSINFPSLERLGGGVYMYDSPDLQEFHLPLLNGDVKEIVFYQWYSDTLAPNVTFGSPTVKILVFFMEYRKETYYEIDMSNVRLAPNAKVLIFACTGNVVGLDQMMDGDFPKLFTRLGPFKEIVNTYSQQTELYFPRFSTGSSLEVRHMPLVTTMVAGYNNSDGHVDGDVIINGMRGLYEFDLRGMNNVGGKLAIKRNDQLCSLAGLSDLATVESDLLISELPSISSMAGLEQLHTVADGKLTIERTGATSLRGLELLSHVGDSLQVNWNKQLRTTDGLERLVGVGGISLQNNRALLSLSALEHNITLSAKGSKAFVLRNSSSLLCCNHTGFEGLLAGFAIAEQDFECPIEGCTLEICEDFAACNYRGDRLGLVAKPPSYRDACYYAANGSDEDADGVCDASAADTCVGSANGDDVDGDGICADIDSAPDVHNVCGLQFDADSDGVADAWDKCAGFDDTTDADQDGVPNGCDVCAGFDDNVDSDDDGVADGCEVAGCTDSCACSYNADATDDDGSCEYGSCAGCMNPDALNYDSQATLQATCNFRVFMADSISIYDNGATTGLLGAERKRASFIRYTHPALIRDAEAVVSARLQYRYHGKLSKFALLPGARAAVRLGFNVDWDSASLAWQNRPIKRYKAAYAYSAKIKVGGLVKINIKQAVSDIHASGVLDESTTVAFYADSGSKYVLSQKLAKHHLYLQLRYPEVCVSA